MADNQNNDSRGDYLELTANLSADSIIRQTVDGKPMIVGSVVMAVEGVMNKLYYDLEALTASVPGWNGRPVIISHPERRGVPVTANSPELLKTHIGKVFNTFADTAGKKLKGRLFLDENKLNESDEGKELIRRLDSHEVQEVSTGLFMTREGEGGFYGDSEWYDASAVNILPDHLAILLDVAGASGVEDGAGFPRLNARQDETTPAQRIREMVVHEIDERNKQMDKAKMIQEILAANAGFVEADKDWLEKRSDDELTALHGKVVANDTDEDAVKAKADADKKNADKVQADADEKVKADADAKKKADDEKAKADADANKADADKAKPEGDKETPQANFEDVLATADPATQESIKQGRRLFDDQKKTVIDTIMANKDNSFTKEALEKMSFEYLEHIAALAAPQPAYAGQGGVAANAGGDEDPLKPPPMAVVNWKNDGDGE